MYTYTNDNSLAALTNDWKIPGNCVSMEPNNQLKVSLLRIWTAFFTHIITGCLRKMQTTDSYFTHLSTLQINTVKKKIPNIFAFFCLQIRTLILKLEKLTALDEMVSSIDPIGSVQFELFA